MHTGETARLLLARIHDNRSKTCPRPTLTIRLQALSLSIRLGIPKDTRLEHRDSAEIAAATPSERGTLRQIEHGQLGPTTMACAI